jgi:trigger factor
MFADVRRALAIAEVIRAATVTDTAGNAIDTSEFFGKRSEGDGPTSEADSPTSEAGESDEADAGE